MKSEPKFWCCSDADRSDADTATSISRVFICYRVDDKD